MTSWRTRRNKRGMYRRQKALLFTVVVGTVFAVVAAMSFYKIAVANAFLRLPLPGDEAAAEEAFTKLLAAGAGHPAARARGEHLVALVGCADCHGPALAGRVLQNAPGHLTLTAPNLTPAGPTRAFGAARWRTALHWGVDGERRALWGMPRAALMQLADDDVVALITYLRTLPPTTHALPQSKLGWRGYVQVALRRLRVVERRRLPLKAVAAAPQHAPAADAASFGPYLAAVGRCVSCHGPAAAGETNVVPRPTAPSLASAARGLDAVSWRARLRQGRCRVAGGKEEGAGRARLQDLSDQEAEALRRNFL